jgi:hypothetical protein
LRRLVAVPWGMAAMKVAGDIALTPDLGSRIW